MSWLSCVDFFENAHALWLRFSCDFVLKSVLLLLAVFALYQVARHLPSAFRHFLLCLAFFCLSLLPFCLICGPRWRFPLLSTPAFLDGGGQGTPTLWPGLLLGIWLLGVVAVMLRIAAGLWLTRRLARESLPLEEPDWAADLLTCRKKLGLRRTVRVLINHRLGAAICAGMIRPCVIVPAAALEWSDEQRRTILHHELGHIRRRDNLTNVLSLAVCAFYWFNPLVWWAANRLRICREEACDDLVLKCGTRPSRYVSYLLEATSNPPSRLIWVTLSQISALKKRVLTILDPRVNRRTIGAAQFIACSLLAGALLLALSTLEPWIVRSLKAGLAEKLGLSHTAAPQRFTSTGFSGRDGIEARGPLQFDRVSRLLALPPGIVPASRLPVVAERYPTRLITISRTGDTRPPQALWNPNVQRLASPAWSSAYSPVAAYPSGFVVSRGSQPPDGPPLEPVEPDEPADPPETPAELKVTRLSLGTLGGALSLAKDINDGGRVVGASIDALGKSQGFIWNKAVGMSHLPCPSGDCQGVDINNSGQVLVVASDQATGAFASYLWLPDGTLVDIGSLGGISTHAVEVNDQGQVIGSSETSAGIESAFFWTREGGMLNLGGAKAVALNEEGQVVGWASSYAFFWDSATDTFQRIGELDVKAQPFDMNNRGEVVGYAHIGKNTQPRAFYWNTTDGMTAIELPGAPASSCAFSINDTGEVLVITRDSENRERTFTWHPGEQAREQILPDLLLPQLVWESMSASTTPIALIGSNVPSAKLAEELGKVDFGTPGETATFAQLVKMNAKGQIAGNLVRPNISTIEAVVWEIKLPKVEESIREVLKQLPGSGPSLGLKIELETALVALKDNDYQAATSYLSTCLDLLTVPDLPISQSNRTAWIHTVQDSLNRLSSFTIRK